MVKFYLRFPLMPGIILFLPPWCLGGMLSLKGAGVFGSRHCEGCLFPSPWRNLKFSRNSLSVPVIFSLAVLWGLKLPVSAAPIKVFKTSSIVRYLCLNVNYRICCSVSVSHVPVEWGRGSGQLRKWEDTEEKHPFSLFCSCCCYCWLCVFLTRGQP